MVFLVYTICAAAPAAPFAGERRPGKEADCMKIAIITGASSGMGRALALRLPQEETFDELWVIARSGDKLEELKSQVCCPVRPISMDLTDPDSLEHYSALLQAAQPEVALLANCSGYGKFGTYDQIPLQDSLGMIDLNARALVAITELTLPYMPRGARILQWDSLSAFQPVPYLNVYAATKAFVLSYSRGLNQELKPRNIRVMAVCPGWVKTPFFDRAETTSQTAVTYFNHVYEPEDVVETTIHDLYHTKKDVSIHGAPVRMQVLLVKLLPHRLVMKIWNKQQKHG